MKKKTLIVLLSFALIAGLASAWALTNWTETGTFNLPPPAAPSFQVNNNTPSGLNINLGTVTGAVTRSYTVTNNGNVPLSVNAAATSTGCTTTLDKASAVLDVGASTTFTLTLSSFTSDGTYTVAFTQA